MKKKFVWAIALGMLVCPVFGQYVSDFQAVYPFNKRENSTLNFTLTKENSLISPTVPGYVLMGTSHVKSNLTALAALKLNSAFGVASAVSYLPSDTSLLPTAIVPKDVLGLPRGGYIACGSVTYGKESRGFIAQFDAALGWLWFKEYPEITSLNAIIRVSNSDVPDIVYIACGTYNNQDNYSYGVILGTDAKGIPVWKNLVVSDGKSDKSEYNDLVPLESTSATKLIAVVGNFVSQKYADKNVILTTVDIKGNTFFSYLYGLWNDEKYTYDEEGYGLSYSLKEQIVITGRTKCNVQTEVLWDDALMFAVNIDGKPLWSWRYDIPANSKSGEYAQKVLNYKEDLFVSGYYKSLVFTRIGSIDAFLFKTDLVGKPYEVRVYGSSGNDWFFTNEINQKGDGIISAGYSNSFFPTSLLRPFSPYVVERYENIKEPCYSRVFQLPYEKMELEINKAGSKLSEAKFIESKLMKVKNPAEAKIICRKQKPVIDTIIFKGNENDFEASSPDIQVKVSPVPTNGILRVEGAMINTAFSIYTLDGKLIKGGILDSNDINVSDFKEGVYVIKFSNGKESITKKFVKE